MRVLVTGASGFIGSRLVRVMLDSGEADVYAVLQPGVGAGRIADVLPRMQAVELDLQDRDGVRDALAQVKPDLIIHLAWYVEHGAYWNSLDNLDILSASLDFVKMAADAGCARFVGVGTCAEYDLTQGILREGESRLAPGSLYAAAKLSLAMMLEQVSAQTAMTSAWARLFYLYGPEEDPRRLVPHVITNLLAGSSVETTSGEQERDYLHVEDAASGLWAVARSNLQGAVNIGAGKATAVRDIVLAAGRVTGREDLLRIGALPMRDGDPPVICADNSRLLSTGWAPAYTLEEGLAQTIAWWQEQAKSNG